MNPKPFALLLGAGVIGCDDPVRPDRQYPIQGYVISGQANGTDAVTGEQLACVFIIDRVDAGGPLLGTWTDTTTIRVIRVRTGPTQGVTHDTTIAAQEVTVTVPDSTHIRITVAGPLTEDLEGDMVPAYPGYGAGDWSCGPGHPLSRVQPDAVLTGQWQSQPIIDLPIG